MLINSTTPEEALPMLWAEVQNARNLLKIGVG
jgi:hypothetical protein